MVSRDPDHLSRLPVQGATAELGQLLPKIPKLI